MFVITGVKRVWGSFRHVLRNSALLGAATLLMNGSNALFNVGTGRLLGAAQFGGLASILALLAFSAVPLGGLQLAATRASAMQPGDRPLNPIPLLRNWTLLSCVLALSAAGASPWLHRFLHVDYLSVIIGISIFVPSAANAVAQGALIGQDRWRPVALSLVVNGSVRLSVGLCLVWLGAGVAGAISASLLASVSALLILIIPLRKNSPGPSEPLRIDLQSLRRSSLALCGFAVFAGIDIVLARHYLRPSVAGYYAAGNIASRLAMYLPAAVSAVTFPIFVRRSSASDNSSELLRMSLGLTAVVGGIGAAILSLFPSTVIRLVFGASYMHGRQVLVILAWAAWCVALVGVFLYYLIAIHSPVAYASWLGTAGLMAAVLIGHMASSSTGIAWCLLGSLVGVLILSAGGVLMRGFQVRESSSSAQLPAPHCPEPACMTPARPVHSAADRARGSGALE